MSYSGDEVHRDFQKKLEASKEAVELVRRWAVSIGHDVEVPGNTVAENHMDRKEHGDHGDIFILLPDGGKQIIEVKWSSRDFTCRNDFPYESMIVDSKSEFDAKYPAPYVYVICNKALTHVAVIMVQGKEFWFVEKIKYERAGKFFTKKFYKCNVRNVEFHQLPKEVTQDAEQSDVNR